MIQELVHEVKEDSPDNESGDGSPGHLQMMDLKIPEAVAPRRPSAHVSRASNESLLLSSS